MRAIQRIGTYWRRQPRPSGRTPRSLLYLVLAALAPAPAVPASATILAAQDFTLQQILSAPMPSDLVAAPAGGAVAWVQNREGARNVWVATAPDWHGRRLTDYTGDNGERISNLTFAADGRAVLFMRGGGPNPRSNPAPSEHELWILSIEGGAAPRMIADAGSPVVSPAGDVIAYNNQGAIWLRVLKQDAEGVRAADVRSGARSLRWSPDGQRLAFVSSRGDHSYVGVLEITYDDAGAPTGTTSNITWMDPGVARDRAPVWSPDGSRIAFLRIPDVNDEHMPFTPRRSAPLPWSIVVADAETGRGRIVWTANEGPGSAFYGVDTNGGNQLVWGAGDRLIFPWEGDGWLHLYSVPADGSGAATLLTPGEFEVRDVALSADGESVIYSSNQIVEDDRSDRDRLHLWRVPVDGGQRPVPLTSGAGIEFDPVAVAGVEGDAVAFLTSGPITPAHAAIHLPPRENSDIGDVGRQALAPGSIPDAFPSDALVVPRQVIFPAADGLSIHGQLFMPPHLEEGERAPALIFFHGGSRRQMLLGFHPRGYYHNAYAFNQYMASRGYVVLSVNYRSGIGYGLEFREALNYGASGGSEFKDVLGAGEFLASRSFVDADRIGLWGGSYGGYLTALGLARASDRFAAGVDLHGVLDWNVVINNFVPSYERSEHPEFAEMAFNASPAASLDSWRSPVLLIHADDDRNVPFSETVDLAHELRKRGVDVELLVFPDDVHGFLLHENWLRAYHAAADFFDRTLRGMTTAAVGDGAAND